MIASGSETQQRPLIALGWSGRALCLLTGCAITRAELRGRVHVFGGHQNRARDPDPPRGIQGERERNDSVMVGRIGDHVAIGFTERVVHGLEARADGFAGGFGGRPGTASL